MAVTMPDGGLITPVLKVQLSLDHEQDLLVFGLAVYKLELMLITKLLCVLMDLLFPMLALPTPGELCRFILSCSGCFEQQCT